MSDKEDEEFSELLSSGGEITEENIHRFPYIKIKTNIYAYKFKNHRKPWPGCSVIWSIVPYTKNFLSSIYC